MYPGKQDVLKKAFDSNDNSPLFGLHFWKTGAEIKASLEKRKGGYEGELKAIADFVEELCKKNKLTFKEVLDEERGKHDFLTQLRRNIDGDDNEIGYMAKSMTMMDNGGAMRDRNNQVHKLQMELNMVSSATSRFISIEQNRSGDDQIINNIDTGARFLLTLDQLRSYGF